jgi:hypothetical protein
MKNPTIKIQCFGVKNTYYLAFTRKGEEFTINWFTVFNGPHPTVGFMVQKVSIRTSARFIRFDARSFRNRDDVGQESRIRIQGGQVNRIKRGKLQKGGERGRSATSLQVAESPAIRPAKA